MKTALVCIAKNEDHYIDEWIEYYLKLGIDHIFIYQNDWRYKKTTKYIDKLTLIEFDGENKLLEAYNNFIQTYYSQFDFACIFDIDEFLTLKKHANIKDFLDEYKDFYSIGINWRLFGDNGQLNVKDNNYSLLTRFTRCERELNKHIKLIINLALAKNNLHFVLPHCVLESLKFNVTVSVDKTHYIHGPFNMQFDINNPIAYLNHYLSKTKQEWIENKIPKGKCDCPLNHPAQHDNENMQKFYEHNKNDIEDTTALDFFKNALLIST